MVFNTSIAFHSYARFNDINTIVLIYKHNIFALDHHVWVVMCGNPNITRQVQARDYSGDNYRMARVRKRENKIFPGVLVVQVNWFTLLNSSIFPRFSVNSYPLNSRKTWNNFSQVFLEERFTPTASNHCSVHFLAVRAAIYNAKFVTSFLLPQNHFRESKARTKQQKLFWSVKHQ